MAGIGRNIGMLRHNQKCAIWWAPISRTLSRSCPDPAAVGGKLLKLGFDTFKIRSFLGIAIDPDAGQIGAKVAQIDFSGRPFAPKWVPHTISTARTARHTVPELFRDVGPCRHFWEIRSKYCGYPGRQLEAAATSSASTAALFLIETWQRKYPSRPLPKADLV